jgi:hypothetical protein
MPDFLKAAIGSGFEGKAGENLKQDLDRLDPRSLVEVSTSLGARG